MTSSLEQHVEGRPLGNSHVHGLRSNTLLDDPFDVVIIGSGAAGAVAADTFVRAGLRTLLVEEGARLNGPCKHCSLSITDDQLKSDHTHDTPLDSPTCHSHNLQCDWRAA
jgi:choline dehydrogenase-like flavoprotein